jgi:hypothetical protein
MFPVCIRLFTTSRGYPNTVPTKPAQAPATTSSLAFRIWRMGGARETAPKKKAHSHHPPLRAPHVLLTRLPSPQPAPRRAPSSATPLRAPGARARREVSLGSEVRADDKIDSRRVFEGRRTSSSLFQTGRGNNLGAIADHRAHRDAHRSDCSCRSRHTSLVECFVTRATNESRN